MLKIPFGKKNKIKGQINNQTDIQINNKTDGKIKAKIGSRLNNIINFNDDSEYKKKLILHKAVIANKFVVGTLIGIILIIGLVIYFKNKVYTNYNLNSVVERKDTINTKYLDYNGKILKYSNDGISCTDYANNTIWNCSYEMQNPIVDICKNYVAVADLKGNKIFVMDENGEKGTIDTKLPIQKLQVASQGVVYAVMEENTNMWIYAFNYDGTLLAKSKQPMKSSGYPLEISVSDNGEKIMVSYLYVDMGIMKTDIAFYNFGSVGQNESDNLVSAYTYDGNIFPMIGFMTESTAAAVGDNKLVFFEGTQKPTLFKEIEITQEIRSAYYSDKYVALVFDANDTAGRYKIEIYNIKGEKILSTGFDYDYTDISLWDESFIIRNDNEFAVYNMSGLEKFHYQAANTIMNVISSGNFRKYVIIDANNTQEISLKLN